MRRSPKETRQEALDAGWQPTAVLRFLIEQGGGGLRFWYAWAREPATLPVLLAAEAQAFVNAHGLDQSWAVVGSQPVKKAAEYIILLIAHLAHRQFGRPANTPFHEWSDAMKTQHHVGLDAARIALIRREAMLEADSAYGTAELKARVSKDAARAKFLHKQGLPVPEIASRMGIDRSTVYRHLGR